MGRATVKTPENRATILAAVSKGASLAIAAGCAGMDASTLYEWKRECPEFRASIARARAERAQRCLDTITESTDWRACAWFLERQYPEDFALVHRIEQVLKQHGLIAAGPDKRVEDWQVAEYVKGLSSEELIRRMTNEQIVALLAELERPETEGRTNHGSEC